MLTSSIIYDERNSNFSLNVIVSFGIIPCLHSDSRMLDVWKIVITNTTISDWGWSKHSSHKQSAKYNLNVFLVEL